MEINKDQKTDTNKYSIQVVERALKILDYFTEIETGIGVTEVQQLLHTNANMAFRLLNTLETCGYITQNPATNKFHLTLKSLQLSQIALNSLEVRKQAMPYLHMLSRECRSANIILQVYDQGHILSVEKIDAEKIPRVFFHKGIMQPTHVTAAGKVLISELGEEELEWLVENKGLAKYTNKSISTMEELITELSKVRQQGLAWELEEHKIGMNCIAAPIRDESGRIIASITVGGFDIYINIEELTKASIPLRETAYAISLALGFSNI